MTVLLRNTEKPVRCGIARDGGLSSQVGKLEVGFGGFSPMALSDANASQQQVQEAERRLKDRRATLERAAAIEAARVTDVREADDACGTRWRYAVLDGREARIERCETRAALLQVPAQVEGLPVVALAADACANLPFVEEISCPDTVLSIGLCAFRGNGRLARIAFPRAVSAFDSDWLRGCPKVERLVLPGDVARLDASIFDIPNLRELAIGAGTAQVAPGAFAKSELRFVEVDGDNPFLSSDGRALYSRDGRVLVALAVPGEACRIREGCAVVAKKALFGLSCVKRIEAPEGLETLEAFAFSGTGIASFDAPASLRRIGEKAFFKCADLEEVRLREGLASVGDHAFTESGIRALRLPSTVEDLGNPLAARTGLTYAGPDATFCIAEGPGRLSLDAEGGLYREGAEGRTLVRMMDPAARSYAAAPGTTAVGDEAFLGHPRIAEVDLPEGVRVVGRAAFKGCNALVRVGLPEGVRIIGDEAFLDTNLQCVHLSASLERLGSNALVTHGAHHGTEEPSLREVTVGSGNARFFAEPGLLLERKDDGAVRVVLCTGSAEVVRIPAETDEIAPYAFNDVRGVRELHLSDRIGRVGVRGLALEDRLDLLHVDLAQPVSGHEGFDIRFPATDRGAQQLYLALSVPDCVDAAVLLEHYDNAIVNASSFDAQSDAGLGAYEQVRRIVERLQDPVLMTAVNRSMCDRVLRSNLEEMCVAIARHDDRRTIDALFDLGYLDAGNLNGVIERVGALQDAAMTGYLLEAKRLRFGRDALDFDL